MTEETKHIDPAALGGITTGVLLTDFSPLHEAAEWVMGHPIWTHEFPRLSDDLKAAVLAQFPDMPVAIGLDGWERARDHLRAAYGNTVEVRRGVSERTADPITTAYQALSDAKAEGSPQ